MFARPLVLMILAGCVLLAGLVLYREVHSPPAVPQASVLAPPPPFARSGGDGVVSNPPAAAASATRDSYVPVPSVPGGTSEVAPSEAETGNRAEPAVDAVMDQANKAYDRGDFEQAKALASDVLAKLPGSVRMMRIMVSASCIEGDTTVAQRWFDKLPPADREQMKIRCDRYGVSFREPPGAQE